MSREIAVPSSLEDNPLTYFNRPESGNQSDPDKGTGGVVKINTK